MPELIRKILRRFILAAVLAVIHTAFFIFIGIAVSRSSDPEASMAYYFFFQLDYPVLRMNQLPTFASPLVMVPVLGGLLWFCYGYILQSLFSIRRMADLPRLGIGIVVLGLLCLIPEFSLRSLPKWEQHWHRGTAALEARDLDKASRHVSEAIGLSPKDNSILDGMWSYLGDIYMEQKDYDRAGTAFRNALAAATANPNSRPVEALNAYNKLAWFYERTREPQRRKECLRKAIELNQIVYEGNSTKEAICWHNLAEIAYEAGDFVEAQALIEHAIKLESSLPHQNTWRLDYMKDQLKEWMTK